MGTTVNQSSTLPDDLEALKALLRERDALIAAKLAHIDQLEHHVQVLTKLVFGKKSEKREAVAGER